MNAKGWLIAIVVFVIVLAFARLMRSHC